MANNKFHRHQESNDSELTPAQLRDVQSKLDELQNNGMTPEKLRSVLFHKMLDYYQVPHNHFLRESEVPKKLDGPALVARLTELGFSKPSSYALH